MISDFWFPPIQTLKNDTFEIKCRQIHIEPPHDKTNKMICAPSQSEHSLHLRSVGSLGPKLSSMDS